VIKILILLIVTLFLQTTGNATEFSDKECGDIRNDAVNDTTILFINGIGNNKYGSCIGSMELQSALLLENVDIKKVNWDHFYNPTDWNPFGVAPIGDVIELRTQANYSNTANFGDNISDEQYYNNLGKLYLDEKNSLYLTSEKIRVIYTTFKLYNYIKEKTKNGYLIIIPHSQGNFYIEAVWAILKYENDAATLRKIRVFGIAAISQRPPGKNYMTVRQDRALFKLQDINSFLYVNYHPAQPNYIACYNALICDDNNGNKSSNIIDYTGDHLIHAFVETYLNYKIIDGSAASFTWPLRKYIALKVQEQIDSISNIPKTAIITHISPTEAVAGVNQKFSIIGTNLPTTSDLDISFTGNKCTNIVYIRKTENIHDFTCTPQGTMTANIRLFVEIDILKSQLITVSASTGYNPSVPNITNMHFTNFATSGMASKLEVFFNIDMKPNYGTTGDYLPKVGKEGYWPTARNFVIEFENYTVGGRITLLSSDFRSTSGIALSVNGVFTFP